MKRARFFIWLGPATVALVLAGIVAWFLNRPATTDCGTETPANHEIRVTEVVVQPWFGKHHVYGIFRIPNRHTPRMNTATMTVRNSEVSAKCGVTVRAATSYHGMWIVSTSTT